MTFQEFSQWVEYRASYGPLNPMLRADAAFARLSVHLYALHGHKRSMSDFMPYLRRDDVASDDDIKKLLG